MAAVQMYHHETMEEIRTEHSSSGPHPSKVPINNNLSELDTLIQDLNTARYASVFKDSNGPTVNGGRPNVQTLLDELDISGHSDGITQSSLHQVKTTTTTTSSHDEDGGPSASNATRELDDLMASLSDFKVKDGRNHVKEEHTNIREAKVSHALQPEVPKVAVMTEHQSRSQKGFHRVDDNILPHTTKKERLQSPALVRKLINASTLQSQVETYAKPQKPTPPPPKEPTPPPENLDCMLVDLTSHMTEQGITTTQKGCCCACSKPIVGQVITALGKTWHPEHFLCSHCNQELGTRNFFERDGKPYCETDYHHLFSPRCAYCDGPILDKCVTALDKAWHPEHFFCAQCGNTFGEDGFHEKDGKPYCKEDYFNMFAPKCGGCNSPIMENYISALNAQWHPECFVCRDCKENMNSKQYYDMDGKPVCSACLGVSDDEEDAEDE